MKTLKKPILSILAAAVLSAMATAPANATGLIAGATFPQQIISELTRIEQYVTQAEQLNAQYQMVYNQAKNLQNMPIQTWQNASSNLNNLVSLVGNAQGLNYATQNTVASVQAEFGAPNAVLGNYAASLQKWSGNLNSQIAGVLQQYGLQASNFQTTQAALQQIQNASQSAGGRMQVMQAGNQISGMIVNELQGLQSTMMAGNQATLNYIKMQDAGKVDASNSVAPVLSAPTGPGAF